MHSLLNGRIILKTGDITDESEDAVVNAANSTLMGGGGVDGAIHRKGGPSILAECRKIRETLFPDGLPPGKAVASEGGNLQAQWVIHTVGPIWRGGNEGERQILADCYSSCLGEAERLAISSIAFPSISTGAYRFPKEQAAEIAWKTVSGKLKKIDIQAVFVFYSEEDLEIFLESIRKVIHG